MVNDEVNNKAINIEIKVAEYSAKAIFKAIKKIMEDAAEKKANHLLTILVRKGRLIQGDLRIWLKKGQLENIELQKGEVKELKKTT